MDKGFCGLPLNFQWVRSVVLSYVKLNLKKGVLLLGYIVGPALSSEKE